MPSPVVAYCEKMTCPDCSPPKAEPRSSICSRTYLSPTGVRSILMIARRECLLKPDVRHHGRDHQIARQLARALQGGARQEQHGIAIDDFAAPGDEQGPVGVAIKRDAEIGPGLNDAPLQIVRGAASRNPG